MFRAMGRSRAAILVVGPSPGFMKKMAPSGTKSLWQHDRRASISGPGRADRGRAEGERRGRAFLGLQLFQSMLGFEIDVGDLPVPCRRKTAV